MGKQPDNSKQNCNKFTRGINGHCSQWDKISGVLLGPVLFINDLESGMSRIAIFADERYTGIFLCYS